MKRLLIIIALVVIAVISNSCKENGLLSENIEPGRRDYEWSVDTLNMPMNFIGSIWGASPNDVWVVGGGGGQR